MLDHNTNQLYIILLVEYDQHAYNEQQSRELQKPQKIVTKGAAFMAEPIYLGIAERVRSILNWYVTRKIEIEIRVFSGFDSQGRKKGGNFGNQKYFIFF